ncbi:MAG: hypothetical protein CSA22_09220 [Deltaproteobacteria bacterium]|nr:MAG: hypothetical protein CSA22_09220 [Deltaproteobacteria bacterium]
MQFCVLNGSPKGNLSVTLQSLRYLEKKRPAVTLETYHVSKSIRKLESNPAAFDAVITAVANADVVVWSTPVYTLLVPSQYKRFIELIHERDASGAFSGKPAIILTTSILFFDHCAHHYLRGIVDDLDMRVAGVLSTDSYDLLEPAGQERLVAFGDLCMKVIEDRLFPPAEYPALPSHPSVFTSVHRKGNLETDGNTLIIVTDEPLDADTSVSRMVDAFAGCFSARPAVYSLSDVAFSSGCMGCVQCGFDHECLLEKTDAFVDFYRNVVMPADWIVFAGAIRDRYLSSVWKAFFDRGFFNNHVPTLKGKQIGMLVSGPLTALPNLREIFCGVMEWQGANLAGMVSDEGTPEAVDASLFNLARQMQLAEQTGYIKPAGFLGVGGHKVFRDDVWGRHRFVFQADHAYYEANGLYDFPHDDERIKETNAFMFEMTADPASRETIRKMLKKEMVKPHMKIVDNA